MSAHVEPLTAEHTDEIVATYCDAFRDYPVMRYVLGDALPTEDRLSSLIRLFVGGRALRGEPMFGVRDRGVLVGAATMTLPDSPEAPAELVALREATWGTLGSDARDRYARFSTATQQVGVSGRHHHLNMIGVRRSHQGQRVASVLLETVHALTQSDAASAGTSLTTENPVNVRIYERFGYSVVGRALVSDTLESWTLFRPRS